MADYPDSSARFSARPSGGFWLKRALDLLIALPMLVVLAPLMAITAALIKLDSPGPAIYIQERLGRDQRPFGMWKFRTMYVGSADASHRRAAANWFAGAPAPQGYKLINDPRVTRLGRVLRRTSLDEFPQLVNVVRGEMSLVGPRPAIPYELDHYSDWYYERFAARPGVTGPWQVAGRDRVPATEMMRMDCDYVRSHSLWLDLRILALTVPSVLGLRRVEKG